MLLVAMPGAPSSILAPPSISSASPGRSVAVTEAQAHAEGRLQEASRKGGPCGAGHPDGHEPKS